MTLVKMSYSFMNFAEKSEIRIISFQEFLNIDYNINCTEELSGYAFISNFINENEKEPTDHNVEGNEITLALISKQTADCLLGLSRFFDANNNC